ncbi:MAG TPA: AMP-binding protein [Jatrophihabitans sp.]|jgi:amino acid adenylation domain-containing protein|nr:AMP-binding protein [Jatrophihabitans sp.]
MTTIYDAIAAQAQRTPDAVAIRGETDQSYRALIEQAAELACRIAAGAEPARVVAMEVARPSLAIVVILAAARCGCPVLPLNAESPAMHREFVLADARPALLIRGLADGTFEVDKLGGGEVDEQAGGTDPASPGDDLTAAAYVIYTSGSTGRPKGVIVGHDALLSRMAAVTEFPGFGPRDSTIAMTAPSFDISLTELLLPLTLGGSVVAAPAGAAVDPAIFTKAVSTYRPTVIQATPSFFRLALAWGWTGTSGCRLWCGGEPMTALLAEKLVAGNDEVWNMYGPTEATIWATAGRVVPGAPISLGEPVPGCRLCLAGPDGEPVTEPECAGEILLYGDGLALGYLNRPELTAERFRTCPTPDGPQRCYRTGDMAQYRRDGTLQFLGRTDGQVKLRGHRIELSELEAVAEEQPGVLQAGAVVRHADDPELAHIALFLVTDGQLSARDVRRWLAARLPQGMRPSHIAFETSLPRTTAGKLDRRQLAGDG